MSDNEDKACLYKFNEEEEKVENKAETGLNLVVAMDDLLNYLFVCVSAKDVPNVLRYSVCEEIIKLLAYSCSHLESSVKRFNYNRYMSQGDKKGLPRIFYKPYDILALSRKAEDEFDTAYGMIRRLRNRPSFKNRMSEFSRLCGIVKGLMRGWLIYLTNHGGK